MTKKNKTITDRLRANNAANVARAQRAAKKLDPESQKIMDRLTVDFDAAMGKAFDDGLSLQERADIFAVIDRTGAHGMDVYGELLRAGYVVVKMQPIQKLRKNV